MTNAFADLAARLIAAHDGGEIVETVAEAQVPADLDAVYALQDEIIRQIGAVGGWKVAAGLGDPPLCSPIPANRYFAAADLLNGKHHRLILAEIEIAVRLGTDLPAGASTEMVEAAIASLHPAIEMVGNPFADRDAMPRNLQLGDLQSNGAVVVGTALDRAIIGSLETLRVTLELDGKPAHAVEKGASWEDILKAICWLSGHAAGRGMPLKVGQVIITGARALAPLNDASMVEGILGDWSRVTCGV
ncbi:fumarylacetoacetate hydrolase family protein [Devosia sp. CAU 1758]